MYECESCGEQLRGSDLFYQNVYYGEYQGVPAYRYEPTCPICGGEVSELQTDGVGW